LQLEKVNIVRVPKKPSSVNNSSDSLGSDLFEYTYNSLYGDPTLSTSYPDFQKSRIEIKIIYPETPLDVNIEGGLTTLFESAVNSAEQTFPMCPVKVCCKQWNLGEELVKLIEKITRQKKKN
jgi:hypothetical protein